MFSRFSKISKAGVFSLLVLGILGIHNAAFAAIGFIQSKSTSQNNSAQTSVAATFTISAQVAGDLNVVAIGWGNSTSISSIVDTKGNTYSLAVGPTYNAGVGTAAIYYAKNIAAAAAGANTVTVTFSSAVPFPDIRIAEYSGISTTSPLDVTAVATGTGTLGDSGSATTTNANDLLVGSNLVASGTPAAGTGFLQREISGWDGDILEDQIVSAVGPYNATAPVSPSAVWIMQMAAFRAAGVADTSPPNPPTLVQAAAVSSTQINVSWSGATDNVAVTGYLIERCLSTTCTTLTPSGAVTNYSDTGLAQSSTYTYRVRATDAAGYISGYSVTRVSATTSAAPAIAFVQSKSTSQNNAAQTSVAATFTISAQVAGDLNVVAIGWGNSTSISSIVDTKGNTYSLAVGPTYNAGVGTAAIYYAKNIAAAAAGANTVTVTFSSAVPFPDIRIAEYSGISTTSPLDVTAVATGTGTTSDSGSATTTSANELLIGSNLVASGTTGAGTGYVRREISGWDGDILEDQIVSTVGAYNATAPVSSSAVWIMQMAAFKSAAATAPLNPPSGLKSPASSGSRVNLSWTAPQNAVPVTYLLERCTGVGCNSYAQFATPTMSTYVDTNVVPSTTYGYQVRATDTSGRMSIYSNSASGTTGVADSYPACNSSGPATVCYIYDEAGRLKAVQHDDGARAVYALDPAGNRLLTSGTAPTPVNPPGTPTVLQRTATSLGVSWPASTGGGNGQLSYNVYRSDQLLVPSPVVSINSSNVVSFIDTGLSPGMNYNYNVSAVDTDGNVSVKSAYGGNTTYQNVGIQQFSVSSSSPSSSTLAWTATVGGAGGTLTFKVIRGSSLISCTASGCVDSTVVPGTPYTYILTATNSVGDSTTATAYSVAIPSFTASPASSTSINLIWSALSNAPGGLVTGITRDGTAISCSASPCIDSGVLPGSLHNYNLTVSDIRGDASTAAASATSFPGNPGIPTFTAIGTNSVTVNWTVAQGSGLTYEYSIDSGTNWTNVGTALTANLSGLLSGHNYVVQVRARNVSGPSAISSNAFTTIYIDTPVMTEGTNDRNDGFDLGLGIGSMSPAQTSNGYTYVQFLDRDSPPKTGGGWNNSRFEVSGFAADPGAGWLISVQTPGGAPYTAASASYTYSAGVAAWIWTTAPFSPTSGTCTIVHK